MFKTYRPHSVEELLNVLDSDTCHIFAGGTDLMIRKRQWQGAERKFTQSVVYINHLKELKGIKEHEDYYEIGTLTTQAEMSNSFLPEYIRTPYKLMATPAIRNVATVGGNIVNAASVADSLPVLIGLDASIELQNKYGKRVLKIADFVEGKYKTKRQSNELLTKVIIPKYEAMDFFYKKLGQRKASILSKLSVFILYKKNDIRIAIGAVNDKVIRDQATEFAFVNDRSIDELLISYKSKLAGKNDKRSTKLYKESVVLNLLETYLKEIVNEL